MNKTGKIELRLFGPFAIGDGQGRDFPVRGAKHKALIAILATAASGTHTRTWLQETLWSLSGEEHGRASLRRALSDLRRALGETFDAMFDVSQTQVRLRQDRIAIVGNRSDGDFLEGIKLHEPKFKAWLDEKRRYGTAPALLSDVQARQAISPRIAVIPFASHAGDPVEQSFSDLLAQEITRALSRSSMIQVISHLSSRRFSSAQLDLDEVKGKLGIDYLLHGRIQCDGVRYRLDADFIQANTGTIAWTRQFAGDVADVTSGEGAIFAELGGQIGRAVLNASIELAIAKPLPLIESHALFISSISFMHQHRLAQFARARAQLEELIRRTPGHSILQAWLAKWYILAISQGWSIDPVKDMAIAADCTQRALDTNPNCALSLTVDGMVQGDQNADLGLAEARFRKATEYDPNHALAWLMFSRLHGFIGNGDEAVSYAERATALSPLDPYRYFYDILRAMAYNVAGDYEAGRDLALRSLAENPRHTSSYRVLAIAQQLLGLDAAARATVGKLMTLEPNLTIESYLKNHPAAQHETGREWARALESAGVPRV